MVILLSLYYGGVMIFGKAEIYVGTLEGEPVVSCSGGVDGFEATTMDSDSDEKIDVTRFETWYQIGLDHQRRWVLPSSKLTRLHKEKPECAFYLDLAIHSLGITGCSILSR